MRIPRIVIVALLLWRRAGRGRIGRRVGGARRWCVRARRGTHRVHIVGRRCRLVQGLVRALETHITPRRRPHLAIAQAAEGDTAKDQQARADGDDDDDPQMLLQPIEERGPARRPVARRSAHFHEIIVGL